jgi:cyclic beta-1,2-glucan synthetase
LRRVIRQFPLAGYVGSILLTTVVLTVLALYGTARFGHPSLRFGIWILLAFACITQLAMTLVNWITMMLIRPRVLPRMDYSKGLPAAQRSIVAVPTMLSSRADIDDLVEALEVRFLANRDANLSFALLTDFRDATAQTMPEDEALLQQARHAIEALNVKYLAVRRKTRAAFTCFIGPADGTTKTRSGWAGSASAGSSRISTLHCAVRPADSA